MTDHYTLPTPTDLTGQTCVFREGESGSHKKDKNEAHQLGPLGTTTASGTFNGCSFPFGSSPLIVFTASYVRGAIKKDIRLSHL